MPDPTESRSLFRSDVDWANNACLNYAVDAWDLYAAGYDRAAAILTDHVITQGRDQDVLVYPIVFLFRHCLELLLKRTLQDAQDLLDEPRDLPTHHDVQAIWGTLRPLVLRIYDGEDPGKLMQLDVAIKEIVALDRRSFAFRYPTDRTGAGSLPGDLRHVNIRRFSELFREGLTILEGIQAGIAAYRDLKAEYE